VACYYLDTYSKDIPINSLLISLILFFGSIFVIGVLSISYGLIKLLTKKNAEINQINNEIIENTRALARKKEELEKTQTLLKEKNTELQNTLEDFYTLRIAVQKDMELGKVKEENEKIKESLSKLKSK
jgi:hypothetical protein